MRLYSPSPRADRDRDEELLLAFLRLSTSLSSDRPRGPPSLIYTEPVLELTGSIDPTLRLRQQPLCMVERRSLHERDAQMCCAIPPRYVRLEVPLHQSGAREARHVLLEEFDVFDERFHFFLRRRRFRAFRKEPLIAENRAAEHHAVTLRLGNFRACVGEVTYIAVAGDERMRAGAVAYPYGVRDVLPTRRHIGHFFARARMDGDERGFFRKEFGQPCIEFIPIVADACLDRDGSAVCTFLCRANKFARLCWISNERGTASLFFDGAVRTAHVDINPVEAEACAKCRCRLHMLWFRCKKLRDNRPLAIAKFEFLEQFAFALLWRADKPVGRGELGIEDTRHSGRSVSRDERAERDISHIFHRRQNIERSRQVSPEIFHGCNIAYPVLHSPHLESATYSVITVAACVCVETASQ